MQAQEINPQLWREFCGKFSEMNRGSMMTIEHIRFDGRSDEIAREIPLERMSFDTTDGCNDIITVVVGNPGERTISHQAIEPIHIRLKLNGQGHKMLQIEAEDGITLVHFHSGRIPDMIQLKEYKGNRIAMERDPRRFAVP